MRFIPAGAGNTILFATSPAMPTVYPRWRGEHLVMVETNGPGSGLSPLARGTLAFRKKPTSNTRFIPAGAGNTLNTIRPPLKSTVYPRWRGEHDEFRGPVFVKIGLSPLARGTRVEGLYIVVFRRFIPAGAGNTLKLYICSKSPFLLHNKLPTVR